MEWIFIYGPPGSGKSTLGRGLAESTHTPFYDLDAIIEERADRPISQIFEGQGEPAFRELESQALQDLLLRQPGVVALGGGALLNDANRSLVEDAGQVICLSVPFEILLERMKAQKGQRPLLAGETEGRLAGLLESRQVHYASFGLRLEAGQEPIEDLLWRTQVSLGVFYVSGMGKGYDVRILPGALDHLGDSLRRRSLHGPLALISDNNVTPLYAQRALVSLQEAGYPVKLIEIPSGEVHKTVNTVGRLWAEMLAAGLERGSTVVALGGGVVGDLAGFAAATYMRGVRWVVVPTSLLAMVDASLGGKTGADLPEGKNLVGAFHPPDLVLTDPEVLQTLPEVELRNGMAEVVKHAILADPELFKLCGQGLQGVGDRWAWLVRRAVAVKVAVIREDPYERGRRASLNLGHTLGHAIELASDFRIRHGEAVSIGTVAAARLARQMEIAETGLVEEIVQVLEAWGLPVEIPHGLDPQRIIEGARRDKKRAGGVARFVLPVRIGEARWGIPVENLNGLLLD